MKVCDDIVEKSVQSLTLQINNGHFFKFFIFPQKYISHLLQEKREGILNEETLPMGFRPIQPFVFCEAW